MEPLFAVVDAAKFNPVPPVDSTVENNTNEWIYLSVISAVAVAGLVASVVIARKTRSWIPIMCMVGGFLTLYQEPMIDQHLQVWWTNGDLPSAFQAFGRDVPVFLVPALLVYYGVGVLLRWYFLKRYGSRFPIWQIFAIETLMAVAIEPPGIQMGLWEYYGFQGVRFFDYPVWWPIVGGTCGVVAGTVIYRLEPYLQRWRVLSVALLLPLSVAGTYWAVAWPMFNLLNKESSHGLIYAGTVLTTAQAILVVWICSIATGHHAYRLESKQGATREYA